MSIEMHLQKCFGLTKAETQFVIQYSPIKNVADLRSYVFIRNRTPEACLLCDRQGLFYIRIPDQTKQPLVAVKLRVPSIVVSCLQESNKQVIGRPKSIERGHVYELTLSGIQDVTPGTCTVPH